jgi:hypothetical protein
MRSQKIGGHFYLARLSSVEHWLSSTDQRRASILAVARPLHLIVRRPRDSYADARHSIASFRRCIAQSRRYRLISVW